MTNQLIEQIIDVPAIDGVDVDPDSMVGEETQSDHDLDPETFDDEDDES